MSRRTTKPTKWPVHPAKTQISLGIQPGCQISLRCVLYGQPRTQCFLMRTVKTDQNGWMPRLIWVFAGHTGHFVGFVMLRLKPADHWSCIAHLSAEDMLKSAVIEEKKFKHSLRIGADKPLEPKFSCRQKGLITMVIFCKFKKNLFNRWLYTNLFMI